MGANESISATSPLQRQQTAVAEYYKTMRPDAAQCNEIIVLRSPAQWKHYFESAKGSDQLMVIDFTASWCGPCRFIEPYIKGFAAQYPDVTFVKIDVDELPMVAAEFGAQALPAFVLVKKGRAVDRVVGVKVEELRMKVESHRIQPYPFAF